MDTWNEQIALITTTPGGQDADGFEKEPSEVSETMFCHSLGIGTNEFYQSASAGITVELKVEIHSWQYAGQHLCEFKGSRYRIKRTYPRTDRETIELTLGREDGNE